MNIIDGNSYLIPHKTEPERTNLVVLHKTTEGTWRFAKGANREFFWSDDPRTTEQMASYLLARQSENRLIPMLDNKTD